MTRKAAGDVEWAVRKMESTPGWMERTPPLSSEGISAGAGMDEKNRKEGEQEVLGILKARVDQEWRIGLLWEGRWKELLFTVGANVDLKRREQIFRGVGLEVQYSS